MTKDVAKVIRKELKENFSGIKFSITSDSSVDAVRISWDIDNGPERKRVRKVVDKYQYWESEYAPIGSRKKVENDIEQVKYVTFSKLYSDI